MALSLRRGTITAVVEEREGFARIEVEGEPCVAFTRLTGPIGIGDDVIVNVQARALGLGSGGFDVLYANLSRGLDLPADDGAHVIKLPYTPLQAAVRHAEESEPLAEALGGLPVVCCSLHSQVAPVCAGIGEDAEVAYVQLPGGALPVVLSDTVLRLRERGLLDTAVAVGACLEGDIACVSVASALAWAAARGFDAVVCAIGPGVVGTGSRLGHGGLAAAEAANAACALGGSAIVAARVSGADPRERHRGISHHTRAVLDLCLGKVAVAWPGEVELPGRPAAAFEQVEVAGWEEACAQLPLSHMGRGPDADPLFFSAAFAAGRLARSRLGV
jgi:hypothetical protein